MKKALIIIPQYLPYGGAVANIINRITSCGKNIEYHILTEQNDTVVNNCDDNNVFYADTLSSMSISNAFKSIRGADDCWYVIKRLLSKFIRIRNVNWLSRCTTNALKSKLLQLSELNHYDYYIPVVASLNTFECVYQAFREKGKLGKCVVYQVDPVSGNKYHDPNCKKRWIKYEEQMYRFADAVIIHPVQLDTSKINPMIIKQKAIALEWPLIEDRVVSNHHKEEICIFFSGYLDKQIRDPQFAINLFERVAIPGAHFFIFSPGKRELVHEYTKNEGSKVIYGDSIPLEECFLRMQEADVLVNIGNSTVNQIPSKIFDYISTGKPIVNFYKFAKCPTLRYFDKYPIALNVFEDYNKMTECVEQVTDFINKSRDYTVDYSTIHSIYHECTTPYVSKAFEEVLLEL